MAIVTTDNKHYKAIADKVREIKGTEETMTPSEMADKVQEVYEKGKAEGGDTEQAYNQGVEAEKKRFWDSYQDGGHRTGYECAFAGWLLEEFYPTHDIRPKNVYMMFRTFNVRRYADKEADLVDRFAECGIVFDTSQCENFQYMLMNSFVTHIGVIDTRSASLVYQPFSSSKLHTIDKLILKDDGSQTLTNAFSSCSALENIVIEGKIGNSITFAPCPKLTTGAEGETTNSVQNIIDALMTITDGVSRTITFHADVKAKLTDEQKATITTTKGWTLA